MDREQLSESIATAATEQFSRSGGPGGQNVNKVNTQVTLRVPLDNLGLSAEELERVLRRLSNRCSADGELVSWVAHWGGWRPVRGSSSRGGMAALKTMIRHMRTHRMGMHILDGPRGPRGVIKPGVIHLARAAQAVLVPFYLTTDRAWVFNSWDRFFLPKPGARATVCFGDPLRLKPVRDKADLEAERLRLQNHMLPGLLNP